MAGYLWNSTAVPVGCYLNCSAVAHSNATNNGKQQCFCAASYYWNSGGNGCWINCSSLNQTNGTVNLTDCSCNAGYYWNVTDPSCWINCSTVANANATLGNANRFDCSCNDGYLWNVSSKVCDRNCSSLNYTIGRSDSNPLACNCMLAFEWNTDHCSINCSTINYSTAAASTDNSSCICKEGYFWERTILLCVADTSASLLPLAYELGLGIPLGLALLAGIGVLIYLLVTPKVVFPPMSQGSMSMLPVAAPPSYATFIPYPMPTQVPIIVPPVGYASTQVYYPQARPQSVIMAQPYQGYQAQSGPQ